MKRLFAVLLCVSLLLSGCFGGDDPLTQGEIPVLGELLEQAQGLGGLLGGEGEDAGPAAEGPRETVPGTPAHIQEWEDPLEGIPEPTYYAVDEEMAWAMSLIGMELTPPEDTLEEEAVMPMDGLWNTQRTNTYQSSDPLTAENLQDFFAMYAKDADLTAMPPILEPTPEPFYTEDVEVLKNFLDHYNEQSVMISVFESFVEKNLDAYNEDKGLDDSVYLYLIALDSWELAMGASFTEDSSWDTMQRGIAMAVEFFGGTDVTVTRNAAHNYTLAYTNGDGEKIVDHFRADSGSGIQMLSYNNDVLSSFFEYICLGDNTYVWQSGRERLLMEYQDKVISSCHYSSLNEESPRNTEADLLYGTDAVPDPAWVMEREDFHTRITYDGTTLEVTTVNFFIGGVGHAVISPAEL